MTVKITQIEAFKFKAESDGLEVISGRVDRDSAPEGMSPGALMAAALGMCTGMHIVGYLKRRNIEYSGFEMTVDNESAEGPRRSGKFTTSITLKADLDERQLRELREEANRCYVGNTLKSGAEIDLHLELR